MSALTGDAIPAPAQSEDGTADTQHIDALGLAESAARLRLAVSRLARSVRNHGSAGLTASQLSALSTLEECGPIRLGDLAARESVGAPVVSRVIDSLEKLELVARVADARDGRACLIELTDAGRRTLAQLWSDRTAGLTRRIAALNRHQLATLQAALPILETLARDVSDPR